LFIVFRKSKPVEILKSKNFQDYQKVKEINGPWRIDFDPKWGGPENQVVFDTLIDWHEHNDKRICYYSGTATYRNAFHLSTSQHSKSTPVFIDPRKVEVMARIRVNGIDCGIAWNPPYRIDITKAAKPGENQQEIDVVNTWINRMIGDEQLPEDSEWLNFETLKEWPEWFLKNEPSPSGRYTFISAKHYEKDDPLAPSGLSGPVSICKLVYEDAK